MICKVRSTAEKYGMFSNVKRITIGVSGGADSCALLHVLCSLKDEYSLILTAVHVNHGIRGAEARRDEEFVRNYCERLGVPFKAFYCDVPNCAKKAGMGVEEYGRKLRYELFESVDPDALIATAHNLNDCCETLIFNMTRGTSVSGLCSIPAVRGRIIRPLIDCTREEIEEYCRENGIDYITDSTNSDDSYSRNRIRLNVIPQLKKINPSFEKAAARLIACAEEDAEYFRSIVSELLIKAEKKNGWDAGILSSCPPSVKKRAVAAVIEKETGKSPETVHIEAVCGILGGGRTQILSDTVVRCEKGILCFGEKKLTENWQRDFSLDEEIITPSKTVKFTIINSNELTGKQFVHRNVLDYEKISGRVVLRSRISGDEIRIAGRNCTKTLKKLLTEKKISDKNSICVLADSEGVIWVEGCGCAERCRVTGNTKKVLKIVY